MKDSSDLRRQITLPIVFGVISIVAATLIPVWTGVSLTTQEKIFLAILIFIAQLLVRVFWLGSRMAARAEHEERHWQVCEDCDKYLLNIRSNFIQIEKESYGPKDLFVSHFKRQLHQLSEKIKEVAERRELQVVQADHFLNVDNVIDAFLGDTERIWRVAWPIGNNERLFDQLAWKRYFEKTAKMADDGDIKQIRIVLVVEDFKLTETARVKKLLDFLRTNKGFECFIISQGDFQAICDENSVPSTCVDFGIYGKRLLFLTEQYNPVRGMFTKDPVRIQHYTDLFDSMWESRSLAKRNPSAATQIVSLEDLYAVDESEPLEDQQTH